MPTTFVQGFRDKAAAQAMAVDYSDTYKVLIIGGTDEVVITREADEIVWQTGAGEPLYLMVATKDDIAQED